MKIFIYFFFFNLFFVCLPSCIQMLGMLKQLVYLDVSKNNLEMVDEQICGCESLQDLLLSNNALTQLPGSIGEDFSMHSHFLFRKIHYETLRFNSCQCIFLSWLHCCYFLPLIPRDKCFSSWLKYIL